MKIKVGTSGWQYSHWEERLYPKRAKFQSKLEHYSKFFETVEINNSFYKLPKEKTFSNWYAQTPSRFEFSVKANRYITHMKNLRDPKEPIDNLLKNIKNLEDKLGPVLFQLPPHWSVNKKRLEKFLKVLASHPHSKDQKYAFEFRNQTWYQENIFQLLERYDISLVIHDHKDAPSPKTKTAEWGYVRLHSPTGDYTQPYSQKQLENWQKQIEKLNFKKLLYIYFNNDAKGHAIDNARKYKQLLESDSNNA